MGPYPHDAERAVVSDQNPMGTDGFEFVEYASTEPKLLRIPRASSTGVAEAVVVGVGSAVVVIGDVSRAPPVGRPRRSVVSY